MKQHRRQKLVELLAGPRFKGDRALFCKTAGITKGRLSQLLDETQPFGDTAVSNLCVGLGIPESYFNSGSMMGTLTDGSNPTQAHVQQAQPATNNVAELVAKLAQIIKSIPRDQREPVKQELAALAMSPDSDETRAALTHYLTYGDDRLPTTTAQMIERNREKHAAKSDSSKDTVRS